MKFGLNFFWGKEENKNITGNIDVASVNEYMRETGLPKSVYDDIALRKNTVADAIYYTTLKDQAEDVLAELLAESYEDETQIHRLFLEVYGKLTDIGLFREDTIFQSKMKEKAAEIYGLYQQ